MRLQILVTHRFLLEDSDLYGVERAAEIKSKLRKRVPSFTGRKHTAESRAKMSAARKAAAQRRKEVESNASANTGNSQM